MSEEVLTEDQSHYEISLTAGQAFVAFVLLLLSLAASFAFGLLIGKGQNDDHLALKKDAAIISEAPKKKTVDLPVEDFKTPVVEPSSSGGQPPAAVPTQSNRPAPTEEQRAQWRRMRQQGGGSGDAGMAAFGRGRGLEGAAGMMGGQAPPKTQSIYIMTADKKLQPVQVRTGISDGRFTQIVSGGLKIGDPVVVGLATSKVEGPPPPGSNAGPMGGQRPGGRRGM